MSQSKGGFNRRDFLKVAGVTGAGLVLAPTILGSRQRRRRTRRSTAAGSYYTFVNKTNGKWKDEEIFWSKDGGRSWHAITEPAEPTAATAACTSTWASSPAELRRLDDLLGLRRVQQRRPQVDRQHHPGRCLVPADHPGDRRPQGRHQGPADQDVRGVQEEVPQGIQELRLGDDSGSSRPSRPTWAPASPHANYFENVRRRAVGDVRQGDQDPQRQVHRQGRRERRPDLHAGRRRRGRRQRRRVHAAPRSPPPRTSSWAKASSAATRGSAPPSTATWRTTPPTGATSRSSTRRNPATGTRSSSTSTRIDNKAYGFCYDDYAEQAAYFAGEGDHLIVTLLLGLSRSRPGDATRPRAVGPSRPRRGSVFEVRRVHRPV